MKYLLVDCDDVLLNWRSAFKKWLRESRGIIVTGAPATYSLGDWIGVREDVASMLIFEFNNSPDFANCKPIQGATEAIKLLRTLGFEIHVITNCGKNPLVISRRTRNLMNVFSGNIDEVHCLDLGESKRSILSLYPSSPWVEDLYKNALTGLECSHRSILLRRAHNIEFEPLDNREISWVNRWMDICNLLAPDREGITL